MFDQCSLSIPPKFFSKPEDFLIVTEDLKVSNAYKWVNKYLVQLVHGVRTEYPIVNVLYYIIWTLCDKIYSHVSAKVSTHASTHMSHR